MLSARQLSKKYGQLTVLSNVTLDIGKGEFVAIAGPSGAGKSTLLHLLGALDFPDTGQVKLMDQELFRLSRKKQAAFRNKHMGFVFQFHHLLPEFTALENVCMPLWIDRQPKDEAIEAAKKILKTVGLSHRMDHKPSELSGGEQQRVAIARAIVHQPSVIFADEPSGNLDTANAKAIHQLFFELRDLYQQTFVIVTHNEELAAMADRTFMMKDGQLESERIRGN
ncbi:ABC transporter ATP-binding protein [Taibaiella koreensis]|uniref:ABC transporter ATP-binding protein n=1 Tax=Taibaiella koreensis TaxID=1268548 RepID=UPI000E59E98C|nr:ABC transporter ATP-binding protein [Taibaiella koreensis]